MRSSTRRLALGLLAAAALAAPVALLPADAAPTCTTLPRDACGGRVVAEPEQSTTFHQYDRPHESLKGSLEAIEALAPGFVEVFPIGEAIAASGNLATPPTYKSLGGRELYVVRITDESVPRTAKKQVAASLSIHGTEPAGREGGLRYIEDLARWAVDEPARLLYAGDTGIPVSRVLDETESWFAFLNPDGWSDGDTPGAAYSRGNERGADLNRDYPTPGWYDNSGDTSGSGRGIALSDPESQAWAALLDTFPRFTTAADIHGELTSVNNAFSDLMWPAGQWSPRKQAQELQLARNMIRTVERKFDQHGVVLKDVFGEAIGQRPANVATAYDVVGYDDSGFLGDFMNGPRHRQVVEIDIENFLSHMVPNNVWNQELERIHVAAVRGNLEAIVTEAVITGDVQPSLDLGRIAYVDNPARVNSADGTEAGLKPGETQQPYSVTPLRYFTDLAAEAGTTIAAIPAAEVATRDLSSYDTIVVDDVEVPADTSGRAVNAAAYVAALDAFSKAGGQLVLTDRAVHLLDNLAVVPTNKIGVHRTNAGHVDFVAGDHPLKKGLFGVPSQTYYEVPLGFPPDTYGGEGPFAPNYGVERATWEAAKGVTVGTVEGQNGEGPELTALGQLPRDKGRITIFGTILPHAIESWTKADGSKLELPHPHGLGDYGVTIAGGQVLHNILSYERAAPDPIVTPTPTPTPSATPSSTTSASPSATTSPSATSTPTPTPSVTITDPPNRVTSVSIDSAHRVITAGNRPTLTGRVDADRPGEQSVRVYARTWGSSSWQLVDHVQPDGQGYWSIPVAPHRQTSYVAEAGGVQSDQLLMRVHNRINVSAPAAETTVGNPVTFTGTLLPADGPVRVGLAVLRDGRFGYLGETVSDAAGRYTLRANLPRGTYAFVVYTSARRGTDYGSKSLRLTVR